MAKNDSNQPALRPNASSVETVTSDAMAKPETLKVRRRKSTEPVVYVGPALTAPYLPSMTIFRGGLPERIKVLTKEDKELARLFVPTTDLAKAREDLKKSGHPVREAAGAVAKRYRRRAA